MVIETLPPLVWPHVLSLMTNIVKSHANIGPDDGNQSRYGVDTATYYLVKGREGG